MASAAPSGPSQAANRERGGRGGAMGGGWGDGGMGGAGVKEMGDSAGLGADQCCDFTAPERPWITFSHAGEISSFESGFPQSSCVSRIFGSTPKGALPQICAFFEVPPRCTKNLEKDRFPFWALNIPNQTRRKPWWTPPFWIFFSGSQEKANRSLRGPLRNS